jgi:hypothetical protein
MSVPLGRQVRGKSVTQSDIEHQHRMLVVHGTPLVAEDLREILMSAGAEFVELAQALPDDPPSDRFDTCFLSVSSEGMFESSLLERAARVAAHVVLIIGFLQSKPTLPPHFSVLSEPFRDGDVLAALVTARAERDSIA